MATPMRRSHYLLSFILSRLVFLIVEVVALVGFGWLLFGVAVRGSFTSLAGITVLGRSRLRDWACSWPAGRRRSRACRD